MNRDLANTISTFLIILGAVVAVALPDGNPFVPLSMAVGQMFMFMGFACFVATFAGSFFRFNARNAIKTAFDACILSVFACVMLLATWAVVSSNALLFWSFVAVLTVMGASILALFFMLGVSEPEVRKSEAKPVTGAKIYKFTALAALLLFPRYALAQEIARVAVQRHILLVLFDQVLVTLGIVIVCLVLWSLLTSPRRRRNRFRLG